MQFASGLLRLVLASVVANGGALAQGQHLPRVNLPTRAALVEALRGDPDPQASTVRHATLATYGRALVPRLHAILTDDNEDGLARVNALRVLGFLLDSSSVGIVVSYVTRPGPFQEWATATLQMFPQAEACAFWRTILRDPSEAHKDLTVALVGMRFCGTEADIPLVEARVARGVAPTQRRMADLAVAALRKPKAVRYQNTVFEGNYPPTGDYTPPPALAAKIRAQLCGGPCPPGMVVQASAVAALRGN